MTGCSGCQVCSSARPGLLGAPGAAGRLAQQLERALGGARIGVGEADVGVDHADEREQREIVALGDELGADDEVVLAARRRVELSRAASRCRPACRTTGRGCGRRERGLPPPRPAARPPGRRRSACRPRGTCGQSFGRRSTWPQWWQTSDAAEAVLDQPGRAVRALEAMAAGAAEGQRRIAAPVEEQQRLLAAARAPPRPRRWRAARASGRAADLRA